MSDTTNRGRVLFIVMTNRPDKLDIDIKRAGRLDRKIPFFYAQSSEEVESVLAALISKHQLPSALSFPRDRAEVSQKIVGYSNADIEAVLLLANNYLEEQAVSEDKRLSAAIMAEAIKDYLPARDQTMLEYMELLAVFESSSRRMLPEKYRQFTIEELQRKLAHYQLTCGGRR
jgi:ATP-dependent 26S proteasome regulatory subunit